MRRIRKRVAALGVSFLMCIGIVAPTGNAGSVKAAEAEDVDWNVTCVQDENSEEMNEVAEDSLNVETRLGSVTVQGTNNYTYAYQVLNIVNQRRAENGLEPLAMDKELLDAAMLRAAETTIQIGTIRPNGESWNTVSSKAYGENAAYGETSPESVMERWMNSVNAKSNILFERHTSIGIGCFYKDGTYYWVQLFGFDTPDSFVQPVNKDVSVEIVTDLDRQVVDSSLYTLKSEGIDVWKNDPVNGFGATMNLRSDAPNGALQIEYSWYASSDNGNSWKMIQAWDVTAGSITACPTKFGEYLIVAKARKAGDDSSIVSEAFSYGYHPVIKGICQMPYTGEGGGYLIGIESYDNPAQSYRYEMLILDCTLYSQGKDAWVYTTGKCIAPEKCLWTIWQPQYGYYWTLFRVYDANGTLLDEMCYGFVNAY